MLAKMSLSSAEEEGGLLDVEDELHSPTDVSEDSVEVRVTPIAGPRARHQRQQSSSGKRKLRTAPSPSLKRRRPVSPASPFRPWSVPAPAPAPPSEQEQEQEQPLALVKARELQELTTATPTVRVIPRTARSSSSSTRFSVESIIGESSSLLPSRAGPPPGLDRADAGLQQTEGGGGLRAHPGNRNYKNMTRERRIEANARERTRVHTISAAFDTLRRAVPAYSHCQKLSKLSVLRIACSYILTLSRVAGLDYSADQSDPPLQDCVDLVTRTIQTEGKLRRRRDD